MAKKKKKSEVEVAAILVKWLISEGWEVYQEVGLGRGYSRRCDIVAVKREPEKIAWLIEVKTSINKKLYWQAMDCRSHSKFVSVAVPYPKRYTQARRDWIKDIEQYGIGFIHIHDDGRIKEVRNPNPETAGNKKTYSYGVYRKEWNEALFNLPEDFKTFCPAGSSGGHLTPFKITCMNIRDYVKDHPGCSLKEVVENVSHHYASDKGAVSTLGTWGVNGVEFRTCLYAKEDE